MSALLSNVCFSVLTLVEFSATTMTTEKVLLLFSPIGVKEQVSESAHNWFSCAKLQQQQQQVIIWLTFKFIHVSTPPLLLLPLLPMTQRDNTHSK
jgi:hypothetical protein